MLNGTVLDVAVGLIFVFLMLSVACSLLNERIQSVLEKRARMLEAAIRKLLGDDSKGTFLGVKEHALVQAISHSASGGMPSYLPSSTFVQALFDTLVPADGEHPLTFKRLRDAILRLPEGPSRSALLTLTGSAEGDLDAARAHVEHWFDNAMDRLSGAYKRHINLWLFALGFVLAVVTNADSILLVQRLEHESALREAVTEQVKRVDTSDKKLLAEIDQAQLEKLDLLFWDTDCLATADDAASHPRAARLPEVSLSWIRWLVLKIAGCLMTALAVSLGAPFWFDLLGRLVNLRAAGAKPPRASEVAAEAAAAP
jgi:hypothetical protein